MKMKTSDRIEYEALTTKEQRAKWLLGKGVVAKLTINPDKLEPAYQAYAAGCALPNFYPTADEAVTKSIAWLAMLADMPNAAHKPSGDNPR